MTSKNVVVYGEPKNRGGYGTSCGFDFLKKGNSYFFTPVLIGQTLETALCDFSGGGSPPEGGGATKFREIMGPPKQF